MSLYTLIEKGDIHGVLKRINAGVSVEMPDKLGRTPLYLAAELGKLAIMQALIEAGAPVNDALPDTGETPLHGAAEAGADAVNLLIEAGANVDVYDHSHITPLHIAASAGGSIAVSTLLDHGAQIDAAADEGETALDVARRGGHPEIVDILLDRGADMHGWPREDVVADCLVWRGLMQAYLGRPKADARGQQLIDAVNKRNPAGVRYALYRGADVNVAAPEFGSPILLAANLAAHDIMTLLIEAGADVNFPDTDGETCLHVAAANNDLKAAAMLIAAGADVNARMDGITPLQIALNCENADVVKVLVAAGADTRGMTEADLLAELARRAAETASIFDWDETDDDYMLPKRLPGLRLPLSAIAMRFLNQIKEQAFIYAGCYSIPDAEDERPAEIFAFVSEPHRAYALLYDEMGLPGVWINYVSTFKDGTAFSLSNCTDFKWLPEPKSVQCEIVTLNDPIALFESFQSRRPDRAMVPVSVSAFEEWFERTFREWGDENPDDFDPDELENLGDDYKDDDDGLIAGVRPNIDVLGDGEPLSAERIAALAQFRIGDSVVVKPGIMCPDMPDHSLSGWQARITDLYPDTGTVELKWDSVTLRSLPDDYILQSAIEGLDWQAMFLAAGQVLAAKPRDTVRETEAACEALESQHRWDSLADENPGIVEVLRGVGDDISKCLEVWGRHLAATLRFPFDARMVEAITAGPVRVGSVVTVVAIEVVDDLYGILVAVRAGRRPYVLPLCDLEALDRRGTNYQPLFDYVVWFANR